MNGLIEKLVTLLKSREPKKEDLVMEINKYFLELVAEGRINIGQGSDADLKRFDGSISVSMALIIHSLQES